MKSYFIFLLSFISVVSVQATEVHYQVSTARPAKEMLSFSIPYSAGTHEGTVGAVQGAVVTNEDDQVLRARFQIPISSMSTGNSLRDCHMREALGIDYTGSRFPHEHICDDNNSLPVSGPDSVQFPTITVDFLNMSLPKDPFSLGLPQISDVTLKMTVHGVSKVYKFEEVTITKAVNSNGTQGFRILTKVNLSLKDFNVQVKPLKIGFISINVKDKVTVNVNLDVVKQ